LLALAVLLGAGFGLGVFLLLVAALGKGGAEGYREELPVSRMGTRGNGEELHSGFL